MIGRPAPGRSADPTCLGRNPHVPVNPHRFGDLTGEGCIRQPHRHHHRVLRLLHLRHRRRAGLPETVLPRGHPARVLASFATFGVGFLARPLGGIVFGHFGDRSAARRCWSSRCWRWAWRPLMGLLPSYAPIGILAPILLMLLRFVQGFAVGGEWGGAMLMAVEHAPPVSAASTARSPQMGSPPGGAGHAASPRRAARRRGVPVLGLAAAVPAQRHPDRRRPGHPAR